MAFDKFSKYVLQLGPEESICGLCLQRWSTEGGLADRAKGIYVVYGVNRGIFAVVMSIHSNASPWKLL